MRTPRTAHPAPVTDADVPLVRAVALSKAFELPAESLFGRRRLLQAVTEVDLDVWPGETVALVGESGSGKSTLGRLLLGLVEPTAGEVWFRDHRVTGAGRAADRSLRREMQMIFQSPYSSLNPRKSIGSILRQPYAVHAICSRREADRRVAQLLVSVGLEPAEMFMDRYPHELSGGQRQRVGIARAISVEPEFIVADEPLSALDMSVQAQILRLLVSLRGKLNLSFLMITHDLVIARSFADRVCVLYLGRVVEQGTSAEIFTAARHPYTLSLLAATPIPDPARARVRDRIRLRGEMPSPITPPTGCPFHTRCPFVQPERCLDERPPLTSVAGGHAVACHYAEEIAAGHFTPWSYTPTNASLPSAPDAHAPATPPATLTEHM